MNKKLFFIIFSLCACVNFLYAHPLTHPSNGEFHFEHAHSHMEERTESHDEFHFSPGPSCF
ncbi:MAG: hypothetical protein ACSNEK_06180 [Parachlamydiaceae bacterium]